MKDLRIEIAEYIAERNKVHEKHKKLEAELLPRIIDVLLWKNENVGTNYDIAAKNVRYDYELEFHTEHITLFVESWWKYGGHDSENIRIPYEWIFSDDWKDDEIREYQRRCDEAEQKRIAEERRKYKEWLKK